MGEKTDRRPSSNDKSGVASGTQTRGVETGHVYQFGPYRLDPGERTLLRGNEALTLPPKAFDTLVLMVRNNFRTIACIVLSFIAIKVNNPKFQAAFAVFAVVCEIAFVVTAQLTMG